MCCKFNQDHYKKIATHSQPNFFFSEKYLLSEHSEGVSIGGISSATIIPTLPPTMVPTAGPQCHSAPGRPSVSNDVNSVKFGATSFTYNTTEPSYLGFVLTNKQKNFFKSRWELLSCLV